jgi:hypothetical protein
MTDCYEDWLSNVRKEESKKPRNDSGVFMDGKVKVKQKMNSE